MRIRQPISPAWRIGLGIASVLLLVGMYSVLAYRRAAEKRVDLLAGAAEVDQRIQEIDGELAATDPPPDAAQRDRLQSERERLVSRGETLRRQAEDAVDRTMPTWGSLYRDGFLQVVTPQGLRKDEYWLWEDSKATLLRMASGLALAVLVAVVLGLLMGCYTPFEAFFLPPLSLLAKIPPTAMLAVFFVLVGTTFKMYVTMIVFGMAPTLAQSIYQSARKDVPQELIYKAFTLGGSQAELIWNVVYKQILPRMIDAVRLTIGPALVLLVAAEMLVADEGFGYRLRIFYKRTDMTVVYVYLILLGAGGLLIDTALVRLRKWLCPWFED